MKFSPDTKVEGAQPILGGFTYLAPPRSERAVSSAPGKLDSEVTDAEMLEMELRRALTELADQLTQRVAFCIEMYAQLQIQITDAQLTPDVTNALQQIAAGWAVDDSVLTERVLVIRHVVLLSKRAFTVGSQIKELKLDILALKEYAIKNELAENLLSDFDDALVEQKNIDLDV